MTQPAVYLPLAETLEDAERISPETLRLCLKARIARLHASPILCEEALGHADAIFTFDPFQAKTLPVFESIYRYGRSYFDR